MFICVPLIFRYRWPKTNSLKSAILPMHSSSFVQAQHFRVISESCGKLELTGGKPTFHC